MGAIDQIVNITISQETSAVPQTGFGIPLIIGDTNVFTGGDLVRYYTSAAALLDDGFATTDPEYIYAVKAFSQALRPTQVGIGYSDFADIATDIAAIQDQSDIWYGLSITSQSDAVILDAAAYIETQKKIFIADSSEATILDSGTGDIASQLQDLGYERTAMIYSGVADTGPSAAWLGGQLPQTPGASTWKFKQLVGVTPDTFTDTERNNTIGVAGTPAKNVNIYETVGGVNITQEGTMAGGQFIDITVGLDWLESRMQENVYALLVVAAKVPYTNQGAAIVVNAIRQTLQQGIANGLIDGASALEVSAPDVDTISANDRASRILPDVTFSCRLAGAFHYIQIQGTVSV